MQISPLVSAITGTQDTKSSANFAKDFDSFLALLTTQLQNQDPLSPLNPTEFTTQLVQFTSVEQSIATNKNLSQLIALQQASQALSAFNYVGKDVEALGDRLPLKNGNAEVFYAPESAAVDVTIMILDDTGNLVRSIPGETAAKKHQFIWDGTDEQGVSLPNGIYTMAVVAKDGNGNLIEGQNGFAGRVENISSNEGQLVLSVAGVPVPIDKLVSVREPNTTVAP